MSNKNPIQGTSKLATRKAEPKNIVAISKETRLKNYRLTQADLSRLQSIVEKLTAFSPVKISETTVIKALLVLGNEVDEKQLIEAVKTVG